ncbi:MAG TPA: hypothetical protein VHI99_16495 [Vicinamibacterales bacterium]|nr:hypothetical protein [Vicinamibacterales bacterium]
MHDISPERPAGRWWRSGFDFEELERRDCRSLKLSALTMMTDRRRFASRGPSGVPSKLSRRASVWMLHEAATAL